jgi:hypothetical protein
MPRSWLPSKETTESIGSIVQTGAIIVGGVWVLYQWNTIFPKTRADVMTAAAAIRTDIGGGLQVSVGGEAETDADFDQAALCEANPSTIVSRRSIVSGQVTAKSASDIPIRVSFDRLEAFSAPGLSDRVSVGAPEGAGLQGYPLEPAGDIGGGDIILGGLKENRIEKGEEVQVSFLTNFQLPFGCKDRERIVVWKFTVGLQAIDPRTGEPIEGSNASKIFISGCQISPSTYANCNIDQIEAYGQ